MRVEMLRVPIPIETLGHVNSYLLIDEEGPPLLVDPGMYWPEGLTSLGRSMNAVGVRACDLRGIVVTHFHVDHATAAPLIASLCPMPVYMGEKDLRAVKGGFESYFNGVLELYAQYGIPGQEIQAIRAVHPVPRLTRAYDELAGMDLRQIGEGDVISLGASSATVIEVPGHTPGHVALLVNGGREAIVGDSILNDISPHVILDDMRRDPLGEYLRTLRRVQSLNLRVAMAGHRDHVVDPARRSAELLAHHERRLEEVVGLLSAGTTSLYEVARRMKWRAGPRAWPDLSPYERYFAFGEALAHLKRLVYLGRAEEITTGTGVVFRLARP